RPPEAQAVVRTLGRVPAPLDVAVRILDDAESSGDWRLRGLAAAARWRIASDARPALLADLIHDLEAPVSTDRRVAALALKDLGGEVPSAAPAVAAALARETHPGTRALLQAALEVLR